MSYVGVFAGRQFRLSDLTTGQVALDGRCIDSGLVHCLLTPLPRASQYTGWLATYPVWLATHQPSLSLSHLTHTLDSTLRCTLFKCKWASFRNINVLPPLPPHPLLAWPGLVAPYCRVDLAKPGVRGTSIIIQPCVSACTRQIQLLVLLPLPTGRLLANL